MTNPFLPPQQGQQAPAAPVNPYAQPAPAQQQPNPYAQPQAAPQQYATPAQNGGSPWPPGATGGAPGLTATPGQFMRPGPPPPPGQGSGPRVGDLKSRLLLILPERCDRGVASKYKNDDGSVRVQDKMIATCVVLDGGPLRWGATQQNPQGSTGNVPYVIKGLWILSSGLIAQLEDALALRLSGGPGIALGRLWQAGPAGNDPYVLADPSPQDAQLYDQYVSQVNPFAL